MDHVWLPSTLSRDYEFLKGSPNSMVRTKPMPDGRYLWQFRKVASYAPTVAAAKEYVEAGAEFFSVHKRNPYTP